MEGEELLEVQVGDEGSNQVSNGDVISTVLVVVLSHQERERATYDSAATDNARNSQTDHEQSIAVELDKRQAGVAAESVVHVFHLLQ